MRRLVFITAAMVLFGCGSTLAQKVRPTSTRRAPAAGTSLATPPPVSVPGTILTPGASPLGAIPSVLGTAATTSTGAAGSIATCSTGTATAASSPFSASFADPLTGALPQQILPGATLPTPYAFGTSIMSGSCDPTASANATIEALGTTVAVTLPGLGTTTAPTYGDATIPSAATEAGAAGMSPLIVVPTPAVPSASPCVGNATIPLTVITDPTALMAGGAAVATTSSPPSLFGC
jgi:hypothetical protein